MCKASARKSANATFVVPKSRKRKNVYQSTPRPVFKIAHINSKMFEFSEIVKINKF